MFKLRLLGARLGTKDVSDQNFIVLRCPFNLLRIFKDGAHRSKTEFMLGPSSGVKLASDTDIPRPPLHAIAAPPAVVGGENLN